MITVQNLKKVSLIDKITIRNWIEKIKKFPTIIKSIKSKKKTGLNTYQNQAKNRVKNLKILMQRSQFVEYAQELRMKELQLKMDKKIN